MDVAPISELIHLCTSGVLILLNDVFPVARAKMLVLVKALKERLFTSLNSSRVGVGGGCQRRRPTRVKCILLGARCACVRVRPSDSIIGVSI